MHTKMRRNFSGVFTATDRGNGAWQLDSASPHEISVYLDAVEPGAAFGTAPISGLDIEWQQGAVRVSFMWGNESAMQKAGGATVHEPLRRLYDSLPLADIDENARRFWRRVFRLVRIPGGAFLLKLATRRRKA